MEDKGRREIKEEMEDKGMEMGEREGRDEDDRELDKILRELGCKRCPNCSVIIQMEIECQYVKCLMCKYSFCWICMEEYTKDHILDKHREEKNSDDSNTEESHIARPRINMKITKQPHPVQIEDSVVSLITINVETKFLKGSEIKVSLVPKNGLLEIKEGIERVGLVVDGVNHLFFGSIKLGKKNIIEANSGIKSDEYKLYFYFPKQNIGLYTESFRIEEKMNKKY